MASPLNKVISKIYKNSFTKENHFLNITNKEKFIVWGYGESYWAFSRSVLNVLKIQPEFIIDKKFDKSKNSNNFISPNLLLDWSKDKKDKYYYIICTGFKKNFLEIKYSLVKKGVSADKIIWVINIFEFNIHHWHKKYAVEPKNLVKEIMNIKKTYNLLSDDSSKKIFLSALDIYVSHKITRIKQSKHDQYFPTKLFNKKNYNNIINCGAFDGDTFKIYMGKFKNEFKKALLIEPDKKNFLKLRENTKRYKINVKKQNLVSLNLALSNKKEILLFDQNKGLSSEVKKKGENLKEIKTDTLDNLLSKNNENWYLILDTEGHEKKILLGAKKLISNSKLNLAVSVYHRIDDLWNILIYLKKINKKFKFYLKNYSGFSYETILYAKIN